MKQKILTFVFLLFSLTILADNKTILLAESSTNYTEQTWFNSREWDAVEKYIKEKWDKGSRIVSATYSANGWLVTMAQNTNYRYQSYSFTSEWPKEWIKQKKNEGYYITSCSFGASKWLVIVSETKSFTQQNWSRDTFENLSKWIKTRWDENYYITDVAFNGTYWTVVMSKTEKYNFQGYMWAANTKELKEKIQTNIWDKNYNIQVMKYGGGKYFTIYGGYACNNKRGQAWKIWSEYTDISDFIKKQRGQSKCIVYVGGGNETLPAKESKPTRQNIPGGGYIEYKKLDDGRMMMSTVMPCRLCYGRTTCKVCAGQGATFGLAYGGMWYPCTFCAGTGQNRCAACNGKGEVTTISFSDVNGNAYGLSSNGSTFQSNSAGTIISTPNGTKVYPNGGGVSSSSSSRNTSNDYIEVIVPAPQYVGNSPDVWCEKCGKYGSRHSHIKKRVP